MKRLLTTAKVKVMVGLLCLFSLQMLAASAYAQPFHFTATSDQRDIDNGREIYGRVLHSINTVVGGPGVFHVSVGDVDYATGSSRAAIDANFGPNFPWYGVVGNHDAENTDYADVNWLRTEYTSGHNGRTPLKDIFTTNPGPGGPGPAGSAETTYSWDYGNAHFIVLNCYWDGNSDSSNHMTTLSYDLNGDIKPALLSWLQNDLAATHKPFIFVFVHEPPFPYNHHVGDSLDAHPDNRDAFWALLESKKVSAVFCGHTHYYFKHRGGGGPAPGYPGHTPCYVYDPNDWRTQDPAIDSTYGSVWEISTGNAGQVPGGGTASPNGDKTCDINQANWWNGVEFIDVNVTDDYAYIKVYQDLHTKSYTDVTLGTQFKLVDTITINGDFLAYNDCVFDAGLVDYNTDPCGNHVHYGDPNHVTDFGIGYISTDHQDPNASYISSGELKDYTTGAGTGVICTMSQSGSGSTGVIWQPWVGDNGTTRWTGGYDTAVGTDAYNTFHGIADMTGVIYYANSAGWWVDVNFTGMDPNKTYTFATSASRAESTTVGGPEPNYNDRWSIYTISGIDAATNASTAGTTEVNTPYSVKFNTGNNHDEGYVARWTGIHPGTDGAFKVRATAAPDANAGYKAYAFSVFMLREEPMVPDTEPPTPNPMTWASLPTATGPTTITMTATTATDPNYPPVAYYFACINDGSKSSGWQTSTTYIASGLNPLTSYTFIVKARDNAPAKNETGWSTEQSATTSALSAPGAATSPSPGNGTTGVSVTTDLSWTAGSGATSHDVYFGTTSPGTFQGNRTTTTFDTGTMSYNTTYYWRIDEKNAGGTTTGTVWSFTTAGPSSPTYVAAGTVATGTTTITPALPAGITTGDILLLFVETPNRAVTITNSNGGTWTEVTNSPQATGTAGAATATRLTAFWSRYNGTQGAPTATATSSDQMIGRITAYHGVVGSGNPWDVTAGDVNAGGSTAFSIPGATTTVPNTLVVAVVANTTDTTTAQTSTWVNSNLSSLTERTDNSTSTGLGGGFGLATGSWATAGNYGTTTGTLLTSSTQGRMSIALKPGTPPGQATSPTPTNGATNVAVTTDLSWSAGSGAATRDVYFGTVNPPVTKVITDGTALTYDTGTMAASTTYYWRVDEKNADGTTTGMVWSFTTVPAAPSQAASPTPSAGATGVSITQDLIWIPGSGAATRDVYFGTVNPPVTKVIADGIVLTYDTGTMGNNTTYYWRIDEKNAGGTTTGVVWSFTTVSGVLQRSLTTSTTAGGTVTQPGIGDFNYPNGTVVDINAVPNTNYHFVNWTGNTGTIADVNAAVTTITMNGNYTIQANFAIDTHTVTFIAGAHGSITGTLVQVVAHGGSCTAVQAVADANYHFTGWTGSYVGMTNPLTIANVTADMTITANFAIDTHTVTFVAGAHGSITGTLVQVVAHGGSCTAVQAVADANYHFTGWTGSYVGMTNPLTITNVTADMTITANFAIDTHTVTFVAGANGSITGTLVQVVAHGGSCTAVQAVADANYHFTGWTGSYVGMTNPLTITNVTADMTITANFAINTFTLTYTAGANGSIVGTTPQTVDYNSSGTAVTAQPAVGYHFVKWSDDSTANPRTDLNVTADITVTASFAINTFTLTYTAGANGSIVGTTPQTVDYNSSGTAVTAQPAVGYHFVKWSDDSTANPRTDLNVTADITVTASFAINTFTLTYTAGANGSIVGTTPQTVDYNSSGTAVTAQPAVGYHFVKWSDDSTANPRTDLNVTADITVTASFAINTFTLTYTAGANGSIVGTTPQTVDYNSSGTAVTAQPAVGYHFVKWSDDSTANPRTDLNVTADITVTASFAINTFTLTYTAGANGSIVGTTPQTVDYNSSGTAVTAQPAVGYHFVKWSDDSTANPRTDVAVTADITVTASFAINTFTLTYTAGANGSIVGTTPQTVDYNSSGTAVTAQPAVGYHFVKWSDDSVANPRTDTNVTANISVTAEFAIDTFTLTYTAGANGSIVGTTPQTVDYNSSGTAVTAQPAVGYHFVKWSDDSTANPRTDLNVTADITVTASFAINTFTLTYTAGANGSIVGTTPQTVDYNSSGTAVTAQPAVGYHFVKWSDDSTANPRTDLNVTADITVTASFAINTFTLTYTAGANGSIVGTTPQTVDYNSSGTAVTAQPAVGYHFVKWSDDSVANPRTDTGVTANIAVTASFAINQMTISGYVTEPDANIPVEGVFINANNGGSSDTTDANGYYQLTVEYGWSGTVEPNKTGYTFEPNGIDYSNVITDHNGNYTAILDTFIISGYAVDSEMLTPLEGVLLSPDNDGGPYTSKYYGGGQDTTDVNGYYEVLVDYNWSGNVVPSKYVYAFEPNSRHYEDVNEDYTADQNYIGTLLTYGITGYIKNECNVPIEDVVVSADNGGGQGTTDVNGFYEVWVDYNWSGTVTPSKAHYTFEPNLMSYVDVLADQPDQNYAAHNIYDLDYDCYIGWGDVAVISENWLRIGGLKPNCVGHWKMNDNADSTTVLDSSGNGKNGTAQQNTSVLHTTGKIDGALTFNGTSDYVNIGNVIGTGAYTKVAWIKRIVDARDYHNIVSSNTLSNSLWHDRNGYLKAGHATSYEHVKDSNALAEGVWYHVAVTFDPNVGSGTMKLYKNGNQVGNTATSVPTQSPSTTTYIGRFLSTNVYNFNGSIDNVMVLNRALTGEEISLLYNNGNGIETIPGSGIDGDFNNDGIVNFLDFADFANVWKD